MLLIIDIIKDTLTKNADKIFGYSTIANTFTQKIPRYLLVFLLFSAMVTSSCILYIKGLHSIMSYYFAASLLVLLISVLLVLIKVKNGKFLNLNLLRIWIFIGIIAMLANGIKSYFF
jgi:4-hydroxybenzoate polyprenyltransferase